MLAHFAEREQLKATEGGLIQNSKFKIVVSSKGQKEQKGQERVISKYFSMLW